MNEFDHLLERIEQLMKESLSVEEKMLTICTILEAMVPHYHWVGFYLVDPENERELVLGPYVGAPTDHTRIPFGKGICGQAAEAGETFLIQDVSKEVNYLSCSASVKSEIVVPIFKKGKMLGQIDIDSHDADVFTGEDRAFLDNVVKIVGAGL